MKALTPLVYFCVAGIVVSFAGSIYTGVRIHQEQNKPQPSVFPTPAIGAAVGGGDAYVPAQPNALPTPAH